MQPCLVANSGCANGKENLRRAQGPKNKIKKVPSLGRPKIVLEVRRGQRPKPCSSLREGVTPKGGDAKRLRSRTPGPAVTRL